MTSADKPLTIVQVAELLGLHEESVRRLAREGRLPGFKAGRSWRFDPLELNKWQEQQRTTTPQARVLVADDAEHIRDVIRITLEEAGYDVVLAATGAGAVTALQSTPLDLVLLDLKMPNGSGVDVIREARGTNGDLPVIVITGYPNSDLMHQALQYSPLLVMAKPVDPDALLDAVRKALRGSRKGA